MIFMQQMKYNAPNRMSVFNIFPGWQPRTPFSAGSQYRPPPSKILAARMVHSNVLFRDEIIVEYHENQFLDYYSSELFESIGNQSNCNLFCTVVKTFKSACHSTKIKQKIMLRLEHSIINSRLTGFKKAMDDGSYEVVLKRERLHSPNTIRTDVNAIITFLITWQRSTVQITEREK